MRKRSNYQPRPVLKPLGMKNLQQLEMPGRVAILALGQGWLSETHAIDLHCHALIVNKLACEVGDTDMASLSREIHSTCCSMADRNQRTGKWGVTGDEKATLVAATAETMPWLEKQPNADIWRVAKKILSEMK